MAARKGAVRIVLFLAASAGARQAWNATAELAWLKDTCISARCSGGGACLPKFRRAPGAVKQGTAWVVAIRRVRRTSATDWANMEHFAAAALPAFDALFKAGERADYLVLPQVKDERAFGWARGADTDWYAGLSHAMGRALAERASSTAFANQKPTEFVFNGQLEACFQNVVHASYVPRATYTADARAAKALREAALFLSLSAAAGDSKAAGKGPLGGAAGRPGRPSGKIAAAVAAPAVQGALEPRGVDRSVTILLRPATDKAARRAGPGWTNARELVAELEGWLASNHVGWRLQVVALGHTYSFQTQLDLFQHTGVVVAAHGASLVNALLMRPGGAVVEVLNCGHRSSTYRNLAQHRGLAYFAATKAGRLRGDDCERDLGRKNIDTRRALPLSEIGPALEAAIKSVEATLKSAAKRPPSKRRGCGPSVDSALRFTRRPGNGTSAKDDLASLAQWIASARGSKSFAFVAECGLLRAASEVSLTVANPAEPVRFDRAFHASRRKLMAAVSGDRVGFAWAWDFALDVFANAFMESQRTANKLVFLHFSKAAGTSFCKLAKANNCAAPTAFSTMWSPGDGPTWGNCARALKAAHESTPILGKGRRRKCGARELSCAARSAAFKEDGYELMAIERWLDNGGDVCTLQTDMWYATLLRDPVSRVVSHHNHLWRHTLRTTQRFASGQPRANKGRYFSGVFAPDGAAGECRAAAELPESLGAPHREGYDWSMLCAITSNYQTRSLLGTAFSARPYDSTAVSKLSEAQVIAAAKYRLINFAFVGVVERADEAANMVRQTLGWRTWSESEVLPRAGRDASTARKVVSVPQPGNGSDLSLLLHHNALDTALYAYANELFDLDLAFFDHGARRNLFRKTISDKARLFCGRHPASKTGADAEEDAEDDDRADPAREVDADARGAGAAADAPGR